MRVAQGSGTQAPAIVPALNASRAWALSWGATDTSPPPWVSLDNLLALSQLRRATSCVLPSWGVATFLPLRPTAELMDGFTTRNAPPEVAPEMMRIASPLLLAKALMAGLGPT